MVDALLAIGIVVAIFVGFNIGGSSTSVAFGPAVGAGLIGKVGAAAVMVVFVFLGGWTLGRNVVETMGGEIVPASMFTLESSVAILLFVGLGMLVANLYGVPVPTSMTAVGAIAGFGLVVGVGCYLGFSAGASNVANAVAPLVGSGALGVNAGIVLATLAIGLGVFTIARRTLDSVGTDITELPLLAALIVSVTAATSTTALSWMGIPISLVLATIMCIVGLGWGRASRVMTIREAARGDDAGLTVDALTIDTPGGEVDPDETHENVQEADELFDPAATARFISFWIIGPSAGAVLSYLFFALVPFVG